MRVLVIDNYDSFTYNLVQYLGELGAELDVVRNDRATVAELVERRPDRLVISPGPCTPAEAGISIEAARAFAEAGIPTLGVCLGHQSLVEAFGGRTIRGEPIHGKDAEVEHDGTGVLRGLESPLTGRPIPLPGRRSGPAGRARAERLARRCRDGRSPPRAARRGRPVPPRVGAHAAAARTCSATSSRVPNDVLTRAIDAVCFGHAPDRRPRLGGARRDHERAGRRGPDRRLPDRAADEGRDRRRAGRPGADDARASPTARRRRPRRPGGHGGDGRRAVDLQHLDRRRAGRRGRRVRGGQARQPLEHQPQRLGRPARGARRDDRSRARPGGALHRRDRVRLHVRAARTTPR